MKILILHNRYRIRAGEDGVFEQEVKLLRDYQHQVLTWTLDNREIDAQSLWNRLKLGINTIWSKQSYRKLSEKLKTFQPDIVHVHNIIPLFSPSIFYACQSQNIPVVQTIHNYRLGCPAANFFREGKVCEACLDKSLFSAIKYKCYRHSYLQSLTVATMLQIHRWRDTWNQQVDGYIVLNLFIKEKLVQIGIQEQKIYLKPNFFHFNNNHSSSFSFGCYYLYVGRLTEEKGIPLLIEGYLLSKTNYPLMIIGTGELEDYVQDKAAKYPQIRYLGQQSRDTVLQYMNQAIALIFPSIWYECCPLTIIEAYSQSLPVIAANLGAMSNLIKPDQTGLLFSHPSIEELANCIQEIEKNQPQWIKIKANLPQFIDSSFIKENNYQQLITIYQEIIKRNNEHIKC